MMCLDRNGKRSYHRGPHSMAPNSQSYFASCLQRCSFIWDSIWNPFGVGKSEKLHLMATENSHNNNNSYIMEEPFLDYGMKMYENLYENNMSTEAALIDMLGLIRPSFKSDYTAFNWPMLPMDLRYSSFRGTYCNKNAMSALLKQSSIAKSMLNRCDFHLRSVEPVDKLMTECKVQETVLDCVPKAHPVKTFDSPRHKQHRRASASLTVSVLKIQRNAEILNQELINRKNRELKKCSKKRRRRQKKQNKCDGNIFVTESSQKFAPNVNGLHNKEELVSKCLPADTESKFSVQSCEAVSEAKCSSQSCSNPLISFILGHISETESDNESDFGSEDDRTDIELCFTNSLSAVTVGLRSINVSPEDSKHTRADCTISIVSFTDVSPEVVDANKRWNQSMADVKPKPGHVTKVAFRHDSELTTTFPVEVYDRKGEWEIFALERFRFKRRIDAAERFLSPILAASHRESILRRLDIL